MVEGQNHIEIMMCGRFTPVTEAILAHLDGRSLLNLLLAFPLLCESNPYLIEDLLQILTLPKFAKADLDWRMKQFILPIFAWLFHHVPTLEALKLTQDLADLDIKRSYCLISNDTLLKQLNLVEVAKMNNCMSLSKINLKTINQHLLKTHVEKYQKNRFGTLPEYFPCLFQGTFERNFNERNALTGAECKCSRPWWGNRPLHPFPPNTVSTKPSHQIYPTDNDVFRAMKEKGNYPIFEFIILCHDLRFHEFLNSQIKGCLPSSWDYVIRFIETSHFTPLLFQFLVPELFSNEVQ